ncbi:MAG: efflux transporter periplasmic adaptor subunit, partial [Alphaproteobacteria bacterium]|nr:efflux transporter periplasmic adaptor subunit [Alphaproteobacteria bacterium]
MANASQRRISWARWAVVGAAAAVAVGALVLLLVPRPVPVDVGQTRVGPIAETVADEGYARVRDAYVISAPVSGRLERVDLEVGDRVEAGVTPVARIRPASADLLDPRTRARAEAIVMAARAAVAAAQAQREQAAAEAREAA